MPPARVFLRCLLLIAGTFCSHAADIPARPAWIPDWPMLAVPIVVPPAAKPDFTPSDNWVSRFGLRRRPIDTRFIGSCGCRGGLLSITPHAPESPSVAASLMKAVYTEVDWVEAWTFKRLLKPADVASPAWDGFRYQGRGIFGFNRTTDPTRMGRLYLVAAAVIYAGDEDFNLAPENGQSLNVALAANGFTPDLVLTFHTVTGFARLEFDLAGANCVLRLGNRWGAYTIDEPELDLLRSLINEVEADQTWTERPTDTDAGSTGPDA